MINLVSGTVSYSFRHSLMWQLNELKATFFCKKENAALYVEHTCQTNYTTVWD